jgi:lipopolysaccharide export system protein LptA
MSQALFTVTKISIITSILMGIFVANATPIEEKPIVITSQTLIADNKKNIVIFEGKVTAKNEDITIYSDKMEVSYDNSLGKITKIHASGNVKAFKNERTIFSEEATYIGEEEKIVFSGEPKAVDGGNVITGTEITYFIKKNQTIVKDGRVVLKKGQGMNNAFSPN